MPPAYEVLLLNTAVPQIQAAQSGDTYVVPRDIAFSAALTLSAGTANGVPYLNGSKVLTTGSALTFDGTNLGLSNSAVATVVKIDGSGRYKQFETYQSGTREFYFGYDSTNLIGLIYQDNNRPIAFGIAGSEQMRLTSTGLGIGTNSPAAKLEIAQAADNTDGPKLRIANNGNTLSNGQLIGGIDFYNGDDSGTGNAVGAYIYSYTNDATVPVGSQDMRFATGGTTTRMTLDSSGNLGLGVTPSAWNAGYRAYQVGANGSLSSSTSSNNVWIGSNFFFDSVGAYNRIASGFATWYEQASGKHVWYNAPSGAANSAIGWIQAMTLDASGNLGIGTTSPNSPAGSTQITLHISNGTAGTSPGIHLTNGDTGTNAGDGTLIFVGDAANKGTTSLNIYNQESSPICFFTATTEKARITSGGNLLVGPTSDYLSSKLLVDSTTTDNSTNALTLRNSSATELFRVRSDGYTYAGFYLQTTASAANVFIGSGGDLLRSTSSLKYKIDVQDAVHGLAEVLQLRPVTYKGKNDGDTVFGGLIAEEVHAAGLTEFVQYAEDGSPDALAYGNMVSVLVKAIQEQQAMINELKAEVAALKGA